MFQSSCISKINNTFIGNVEDCDIAIAMHNMLDQSDNYSITSGNVWNHYTDKVNDGVNENNDAGCYKINYKQTATSKSSSVKQK